MVRDYEDLCTGGDSRPAHAGICGTFICGFTPERDGEGMNEIAAHAGSGAENIRKTAAVVTSATAPWAARRACRGNRA